MGWGGGIFVELSNFGPQGRGMGGRHLGGKSDRGTPSHTCGGCVPNDPPLGHIRPLTVSGFRSAHRCVQF